MMNKIFPKSYGNGDIQQGYKEVERLAEQYLNPPDITKRPLTTPGNNLALDMPDAITYIKLPDGLTPQEKQAMKELFMEQFNEALQ